MALYHDAVSVLTSIEGRGSLKSRIYDASTGRSNPSQVYALVSETSKRDAFLKEVIDNAQLLRNEPKSGICTPHKHPLRQSIERNKARLQSEFTRARLRRSCASLNSLKLLLEQEAEHQLHLHPRWVRLNPLVPESLSRLGHGELAYKRQTSLDSVLDASLNVQSYCQDTHVPSLFAFSPGVDLTKSASYKQGELILQDKASCFPAYLLLGDEVNIQIGDVIDGCAAPGNKTTHLAAILREKQCTSKLFACERDSTRSATLFSMVAKAAAIDQVSVLAKQDFLSLNVEDLRFANVTHLLLDPSCSGSGILGREDIPNLALPTDPRTDTTTERKTGGSQAATTKKRKREIDTKEIVLSPDVEPEVLEDNEEVPISATKERLQKLSNIQTRIVKHAMSFPAAKRITYSTCSIHEEENEVVVSRLLNSQIARNRGWNLLRRSNQVKGMRIWNKRGVRSGNNDENVLNQEQLEACIRCYPYDDERTMGFFVCAFEREPNPYVLQSNQQKIELQNSAISTENEDDRENEDDSWEGFD